MLRDLARSAPRTAPWLERAIASLRNAAFDWRAVVLVALVSLCAALPGVAGMPVMDVDEARFAQASRQMLESGDFVRIRLQSEERHRKPAGVHWLQAGATAALLPLAGRQNAIWTYRLPSVLGALLAALATLWAGRTLLGPPTALLGACLLGSSMLVGFEGMTAKTDALMLGFTTLSLAALAPLRAAHFGHASPLSVARARRRALIFWAALACAILIKGPVPLAIVLLTLLTLAIWDRRTGWLAPLAWWPGPVLALAIVLPWGLAIGFATDWGFYRSAFGQDFAPKLAGQDHAHGGVFGYHLLLAPLLMFPAAFVLPAVARALFARRAGAADASALRFLIAWAAPTWLMFELSPGKLIHYAMPVYPALALLGASGFLLAVRNGWRWTLWIGAGLFLISGWALSAATGVGLSALSAPPPRAVAAAVLCAVIVAAGGYGLLALRSGAARASAAIAAGLLLCIVLRGAILPALPQLQVSARSAAALAALDAPGALWVVGYDEPSIVFLTRTSAAIVDAEQAARRAAPGDAILVERQHLETVRTLLASRALVLDAHQPAIDGISMSANRPVSLVAGAVVTSVDGD